MAIRPKTLSAAVAPVVVGTALAVHDGGASLLPALAALVGAVLIQIATNLSNDVMDFRRGADHGERLGPTRVTQAGLLAPREVAIGAVAAFAGASLAGLYLIRVAGPPILVLGVAAVLSGILYTAGPMAIAYVGLGEIFVLAFFGLAAVAGTYYVQMLALTPTSLWLGVAVGALAVVILDINNLRDLPTDRAAGKRTLAVRIGPSATRAIIAALLAAAFAVPIALIFFGRLPLAALLVLLAAPQALRIARAVGSGVDGRALNPLLGATARLQMLYAVLLATGIVVGAGFAGPSHTG
jgi:1,4-dihydroxy-2-naphthoate octaprenyltransferase